MKKIEVLNANNWQVEDAFFGALLGAVFGIIVPQEPWYVFLLLVVLLGGIVMYLKQASQIPRGEDKIALIGNAFLITTGGSISFFMLGYFKISHSIWLIGVIIIWSLLKLKS